VGGRRTRATASRAHPGPPGATPLSSAGLTVRHKSAARNPLGQLPGTPSRRSSPKIHSQRFVGALAQPLLLGPS
jgi:hypothetical protein